MCLRTLNITSFLLLHTSNQTCSAFSKTSAQTHLHPLPRSFFWCLANTRRTTVTPTCINSLCTLSSAHTQTHTNAHTCTNLKIHPERLLCGIQSQCSRLESLSTASDVTSARSVSCSPPPSPQLPSSFLSSFISWAHLLTLQKVFLTCLSPLPSSTNAFFPALYREHASLSETYVLCRVNALAFASPWSW